MGLNARRLIGVFARDASESVHMVRALEQVKAQTYDVEYPQFRARQLIPAAQGLDPNVRAFYWRSYDRVGMAKIIAGYSTDLPRVDVYGTENQAIVRDLGDSYGYNIIELRQSSRDGTALDQRKSNAARIAIEQLIDQIALTGDATHNLKGLANQDNVSTYTVPNGAGGFATWATKTSDEILTDLFGMGDTVVTTTKGLYRPDTLVLPQAQASLISRMRLDETGSTTVLSHFLATSQHIRNVEVWDSLDGAGSGGTDRAIAYPRSSDVLELIIPQEFEQLAGQPRNLEIVTPCHARCGGVVVYRPAAIVYADGL